MADGRIIPYESGNRNINLDDLVHLCLDIAIHLFDILDKQTDKDYLERQIDKIALACVSKTFDQGYKQSLKIAAGNRINQSLVRYGFRDIQDRNFADLPSEFFSFLQAGLNSFYNDRSAVENYFTVASAERTLLLSNISPRLKLIIIITLLKELGFNFFKLDKNTNIEIADENYASLIRTVFKYRRFFGIGLATDRKYKAKDIKACQTDIEKLMAQDSPANQWIYRFIIDSLRHKADTTLIDTIIHSRETDEDKKELDEIKKRSDEEINNKIKKIINVVSKRNERLVQAFLIVLESCDDETYVLLRELIANNRAYSNPKQAEELVLSLVRTFDTAPEVIRIVKTIFEGETDIQKLKPYIRALLNAVLESDAKIDLSMATTTITQYAYDYGIIDPIHVLSLLIYIVACKECENLTKMHNVARDYFGALSEFRRKEVSKSLPDRLATKLNYKCVKLTQTFNAHIAYFLQPVLFYPQALMASAVAVNEFIKDSGDSLQILNLLRLITLHLASYGDVSDSHAIALQGLAYALAKHSDQGTSFETNMQVIDTIAPYIHPNSNAAQLRVIQKLLLDFIHHLDTFIEIVKAINDSDIVFQRIKNFSDAFLLTLKLDREVATRYGKKLTLCLFFIEDENEFRRIAHNITVWFSTRVHQDRLFQYYPFNLFVYNDFLATVLDTLELYSMYFDTIDDNYEQPVFQPGEEVGETVGVKVEEFRGVEVKVEPFYENGMSDDAALDDVVGMEVEANEVAFETNTIPLNSRALPPLVGSPYDPGLFSSSDNEAASNPKPNNQPSGSPVNSGLFSQSSKVPATSGLPQANTKQSSRVGEKRILPPDCEEQTLTKKQRKE